jgi:hypothetical protein
MSVDGDQLEQLASSLQSLLAIAAKNGWEDLTYLLEMARLELVNISDKEQEQKSPPRTGNRDNLKLVRSKKAG